MLDACVEGPDEVELESVLEVLDVLDPLEVLDVLDPLDVLVSMEEPVEVVAVDDVELDVGDVLAEPLVLPDVLLDLLVGAVVDAWAVAGRTSAAASASAAAAPRRRRVGVCIVPLSAVRDGRPGTGGHDNALDRPRLWPTRADSDPAIRAPPRIPRRL